MRVFEIVLRKTFFNNIFLNVSKVRNQERRGRDHEREGRDHERQRMRP